MQPQQVAQRAQRERYLTPQSSSGVLRLDANEGAAPPLELLQLEDVVRDLQRYPNAAELEALLAERSGVAAEQVVVTAGADDALQRICLALLEPGREAIVPVPTFEMIERYVELSGAKLTTVPDDGATYPTQAVLQALERAESQDALVFVLAPSNPTGSTVSADDVRALARAASGYVVVDLAYAEFEDADLMQVCLSLPNVIAVRTFSKAWGLAGLRVGWAVGSRRTVDALRSVGAPYAVAGPSLAIAAAFLRDGGEYVDANVRRIRFERERLVELLGELGCDVGRASANFVLARTPRRDWIVEALASLRIAVRTFGARADLEDAVRITCPCSESDLARLEDGLRLVCAPEALLFDLDGVLADVSHSYDAAIVATAQRFGVRLDAGAIDAARSAGNANCDWQLTYQLVRAGGADATLDEVTREFERVYQGTAAQPGLYTTERALVTRAWLEQLAGRVRLGIVTGRPRADAERFLDQAGLRDLFEVVVTREDAPLKPDPAPVRLALEQLGVQRAWMIGDTPDDVRAAAGAGVLPLGVSGTDESTRLNRRLELRRAGALRVFECADELTELLG